MGENQAGREQRPPMGLCTGKAVKMEGTRGLGLMSDLERFANSSLGRNEWLREMCPLHQTVEQNARAKMTMEPPHGQTKTMLECKEKSSFGFDLRD